MVKLGCPKTILSFSPLVKGALNSTILLAVESLTQRFPEESNASPEGKGRLLWFADASDPSVTKSFTPRTVLALSPLVKGIVNSNTLPLLASTTQRLPVESKVIWFGERRLEAVGLDEFLPLREVKLSKPITTDAF